MILSVWISRLGGEQGKSSRKPRAGLGWVGELKEGRIYRDDDNDGDVMHGYNENCVLMRLLRPKK